LVRSLNATMMAMVGQWLSQAACTELERAGCSFKGAPKVLQALGRCNEIGKVCWLQLSDLVAVTNYALERCEQESACFCTLVDNAGTPHGTCILTFRSENDVIMILKAVDSRSSKP
jgi:hypothetical protein